MNKLIQILCIALVLNLTISVEESVIDTIYDMLIHVAKGMTKDGTTKCADLLGRDKDKILDLIQKIMKDFAEGTDFFKIIEKYSSSISEIDPNIMTDCNVLAFINLFKKITEASTIKEIGQTIKTKSEQIYNLINKIMNSESDDAMKDLGSILSIILNIFVN